METLPLSTVGHGTMRLEDEIRRCGPGKFSTILDSVVYTCSLGGCCEEQLSCEHGGFWYGSLLFERGEVLEGIYPEPDAGLNTAERSELARNPYCIIHEDSQGFVDVEYFNCYDNFEVAWRKIEDWYDEHFTDEDWPPR